MPKPKGKGQAKAKPKGKAKAVGRVPSPGPGEETLPVVHPFFRIFVQMPNGRHAAIDVLHTDTISMVKTKIQDDDDDDRNVVIDVCIECGGPIRRGESFCRRPFANGWTCEKCGFDDSDDDE